jgi:hypothetical protein
MKHDSIPGLEPEQVAQLIGLTLRNDQGEGQGKDGAIQELLQDRLAETVAFDDSKRKGLPLAIGRLLKPRRLETQRSLRSILLDPGAALNTIKKIRAYAKEKAARTDDEAEHVVMTTIYFAAIANRLAFHGQRITTYSYDSLASSLRKLRSKSWMPPDLSELFEKAEQACRSRT